MDGFLVHCTMALSLLKDEPLAIDGACVIPTWIFHPRDHLRDAHV